jgi:hypothetical protein
VELIIEPEPDPDERDALTAALERLLHGEATPAAYGSRWREAGIRENVEPDSPDD